VDVFEMHIQGLGKRAMMGLVMDGSRIVSGGLWY